MTYYNQGNQQELPPTPQYEEEYEEGEEGQPEEQQLAPPEPDRNAILAERAKELASRAQSAAEGSLYSIGGLLDAPTKEANGDDLSDLFAAPSQDDPNMRTDDLLAVDEEDVFGGDSDMADLLEVSDEDVMGDDFDDLLEGPARVTVNRPVRRPPVIRRSTQSGGLGGMVL